MEDEKIVDEPKVENEERRALRTLLGGRMLRKRRTRRLMLAYLLSHGDDAEDNEVEDDAPDDQQILRILIGGRALRGNKMKKLALAKLLRAGDEDEDEAADDEGDEQRV